jgi:serine/threonine protein kinase
MADLTGKVIKNRYRVDELLGRGSMAEVYRVHDLKRGCDLAMKVLREDLAEDNLFIRRFEREGQTLAQLAHSNVVRFYGLDHEGEVVFLLMEFIDGVTLRKIISKKSAPFSNLMALAVMGPLCSALNFAHQSGRVHCDIKPANIMIDKNNHVFITDFGIARMSDAATATMVGAGTPAYMAPEQIMGKNPTPQTDIYSMGVMLFEMLTGGERPFKGEQASTGSNTERIRWEQLHTPAPAPSSFNHSISTDLDRVVLCCLEKNPKKRFKSITEFYRALKQAMQYDGKEEIIYNWKISKPTPPYPPHPSHSPQAVNTPVLVLIAGGVALLVLLMIMMNSGNSIKTSRNYTGSTPMPVQAAQVVRIPEVVVDQATATPYYVQKSPSSFSSSSSGSCYKYIANLGAGVCGKMRVGWGRDSLAKHCNLLNGHRVELIARSPDGTWAKAIAPDSKVGWISIDIIEGGISNCNLEILY